MKTFTCIGKSLFFPLLLRWTRKEKNLEGMLISKKTEFTSPVQLSGGKYLNFLVKHKNYFVHP